MIFFKTQLKLAASTSFCSVCRRKLSFLWPVGTETRDIALTKGKFVSQRRMFVCHCDLSYGGNVLINLSHGVYFSYSLPLNTYSLRSAVDYVNTMKQAVKECYVCAHFTDKVSHTLYPCGCWILVLLQCLKIKQPQSQITKAFKWRQNRRVKHLSVRDSDDWWMLQE